MTVKNVERINNHFKHSERVEKYVDMVQHFFLVVDLGSPSRAAVFKLSLVDKVISRCYLHVTVEQFIALSL